MAGDPKKAPASRRRLMLTRSDIHLFRWLWMLRVLTLDQLRRLGYYQPSTGQLSSLHNVRKRLRRLWNAGFLSGDTLFDTRERIYTLTEKALQPLRDHYGIVQKRLYHPRRQETMSQLRHPLLVNECAVRVVESLRHTDIRLLDIPPLWCPFIHTHAIGNAAKKKHVERFVSQENIRVAGRVLRIRPDLVFALARGDSARLYFLEADRGSESPQQVARKQLAYRHYATAVDPEDPQRYLWERYGTFLDFRVLFVTTHHRRVNNLCRYLEERSGYELFAFAAEQDLLRRNAVYDGIWRTDQGTGRALVRRSPSD